ncbi:MAG: class I SAM-dependent methyltransferase [Bdellovibrionales bacterium]|nr:class I SAM-dependent methyltransferase [Bdellovibrionales bacterium]
MSSSVAKERDVIQSEGHATNGHSKPDVPGLMAQIRQRVKEDTAQQEDSRPAFRPESSEPGKGSKRKAGELLYSEELRYLNSNYSYSLRNNFDALTSHRPGIIGKVIVKVKRKLLSIIWDSLLKEYFEAEKEYQANVVRFLNDVSKYVDERDASNFWELIRKIDVDVTKAIERIERISDEQMGSIRSSERRVFDALDEALASLRGSIEGLTGSVQKHDVGLRELESVASGLEGIIAKLGRDSVPHAEEAGESKSVPDYSYLMLENRFRGSEEAIKNHLKIYPPIFQNATAPILEIGSGRGELLELFGEGGKEAYGVDIDHAMVEAACAKGLRAELGDGIAHLRSLSPNSLGGVIAIQVVEHLTQAQLEELFELVASRVVSGGKAVFETINPQSVMALSSNYFRDPTHVFPLHPDTLSYTMKLAGLPTPKVTKISPVPQEAQLKPLPVESYMTPRWAFVIERLNWNFDRLNDLLYGHQDYFIEVEVP